jgi:hypothetical protein
MTLTVLRRTSPALFRPSLTWRGRAVGYQMEGHGGQGHFHEVVPGHLVQGVRRAPPVLPDGAVWKEGALRAQPRVGSDAPPPGHGVCRSDLGLLDCELCLLPHLFIYQSCIYVSVDSWVFI